MKEYRNKLKNQNIIFSICAIALIAFQVLVYTNIIEPKVTDAHWADFWNGFIAGVAMGISVIMIIGIVINLMALKNEEKLKKLYVKENDERTKEIAIKGKSAGSSAYLCCALAGSIIAGYFSVTVCVTCVVCIFIQSLFMIGGKVYYCRKL